LEQAEILCAASEDHILHEASTNTLGSERHRHATTVSIKAMLTRLYIDNFRCFVNFECHFSNKQLIVGRNGSGKTSLLEVLLFLRQFAIAGQTTDNSPTLILNRRTRWFKQPQQTFEIEASIDDASYAYRLVIEPWDEPVRARVASETVHFNRKPIFEFIGGEVHLYNDQFEHKVAYPFDPHRSALATITEGTDNAKLIKFRNWFSNLICFKLNPFSMDSRTEAEQLYPNADLSNFTAWYRHLVQTYPTENYKFLDDLKAVMEDFESLKLEPFGENVRLLLAEFASPSKSHTKFSINELSDGQRCLICLYAILHFVVANGSTVILDEPENFLSLREIQPWLIALTDVLDEGSGQVLLISHHPEFINQWAPKYGIQLIRDGAGPVRTKQFVDQLEYALPPAELVARGWELE